VKPYSSIAVALMALLGSASGIAAQQVAVQEIDSELTLERAVSLARGNNPAYLSQANDSDAASWQVREAWGGLLPSVTAGAGAAYTEAGVQRIGTLDFGAQSTDYYSSSYNLNLNWTLNGSTLYGISNARANARATDAGIEAAAFSLRTAVTAQYTAALRARDAETVARDTYERAQRNLEIVQTRVATGFAAGTEATQAEVVLGRAEVALVRAERSRRAEIARLSEQLGVALDDDVDLVDRLDVFRPAWDEDQLLQNALRAHPSLSSFEARVDASGASLRQVQSSYLPSISVSTGWSGNALEALNEEFILTRAQDNAAATVQRCEQFNALESGLPGGYPGWNSTDCNQFAYTPDMGQAALDANSVFPFDYTTNPVTVRLNVSIPIFQGFTRQRQVEQASAARRDARHSLRAEELRIRTAVRQSHADLDAAWRSIEIEQRNLELAETQLEQARQRYQVGNTSIIELMDAETSLSTAQRDQLNAIYSFHQALVALEAATGQSLRPSAGGVDDDGNGAEGRPDAMTSNR
jgi:outer membrane protein